MLAAACNTFPLTEMKGIIPRAENICRVICYLCLEGQQSLMIRLIPNRQNSKSFYMQQYNEKEEDGLEVN